MRRPDDVEELHLIAEYHTARRALRNMGWGSIVFGLINIATGAVFTFQLHPINALLALIGLSLLLSGIWCLALPGAVGVITNGAALILVGLWNIFIMVLDVAAGHTPQVWWALFGAFQIGVAVQCFRKYTRFARALRHRVSKEELAMMDRLVKTILKANAKEDGDIVAFRVRGSFTKEKVWRGQLGEYAAVFVEKTTKEVLVGHRGEVSVKPHGKLFLSQTLKAAVRIGDQKWEAAISPQSFDRFRDWKFRETDDTETRPGSAEADQCDPETGIRTEDARKGDPPAGIKEASGESEKGT